MCDERDNTVIATPLYSHARMESTRRIQRDRRRSEYGNGISEELVQRNASSRIARARRCSLDAENQEDLFEPIENVMHLRTNPTLCPHFQTSIKVDSFSIILLRWLVWDNALYYAFSICNRLIQLRYLMSLRVKEGSQLLCRMQSELAPKENLYERTVSLYNASKVSSLLSGISLQKSICEAIQRDVVEFLTCNEYRRSINWYSRSNDFIPPTHAISNNFAYAPSS